MAILTEIFRLLNLYLIKLSKTLSFSCLYLIFNRLRADVSTLLLFKSICLFICFTSWPSFSCTVNCPTRRPSYTTVTYNEKDLSQFHVGSLVVGSVSVSHYEPMLVDSVDFIVMFLTPWFPTIFSPPLPGFLEFYLMLNYGSQHLLPPVAG